jgi:adenylosuccinate synthase
MDLYAEIISCWTHLEGVGIYIHENAVVRQQWHIDEENNKINSIGSTNKGVGAAAIDRIKRNPDNNLIIRDTHRRHKIFELVTVINPQKYQRILRNSRDTLIEGAQGCSLSIYSQFYPFVTSRDVSVHQIMADCAIPRFMSKVNRVIGTCRSYPIRVANRYDKDGTQIGWSGPCYKDQEETSFEEIGVPVEYTTVTKLPRRVFTFSKQQIQDAILYNEVDEIFLNFANYGPPEKMAEIIRTINSISMAKVKYIGYGASVDRVVEV